MYVSLSIKFIRNNNSGFASQRLTQVLKILISPEEGGKPSVMSRTNGDNSTTILENELIEQTPDHISASLDRLGVSKKVRLAISGDITSDNTYGEGWLVATDTQLFIYDTQDNSDPSIAIPLIGVETIEICRYVGSNALRVGTPGRSIEVLRFTNTLVPKFEKVMRTLLELTPKGAQDLREGKIQAGGNNSDQQIRCPKCGRLIPSWTPVCPACVSKKAVISRLLHYAKPHMRFAVAGFILSVVLTTASLAPPYLMKVLIDDAIGGSNQSLLVLLAVSLVAIYLLRAAFSAGRNYVLSRLGQKIMVDLRRSLYGHLQVLSLSFYDKRKTGRIMSRVMSDTERVQYFITWGVQQLIMDILLLIFIGLILFSMNWQLALIVLTPAPVLVVGTRLFSKKIHGVYHKAWRRWANLSAILADTIPGIVVVKAFAQEARERNKFNESTQDLYQTNIKISVLEGTFFPAMGFITTLGAVSIWWFGGQQILSGILTLGMLTAFIGYTWQFYGPIERLSNLSRTLLRSTTSAERIFEVLDTGPEVYEGRNAVDPPPVRGDIKFHDVSFAYETGETVLKNLDFEINPGQRVGIVGPSGAGKTTLVKLILRFYDPTIGRITIDGYDLRKVKKESLRLQIGMVLQEPFLFSGSIAENISYGNPEAAPEEIIEAAKAANIHDFILTIPEAYDSEVGERGHRLSGGEKQRVSIARALLKDPKILILDEATSSVDTETESLIQEALNRLMENRTSIIIAHRLSTVKNTDKIIVLDEGEIVEEGPHEQLLESGGLYSRLCRMQAALAVITD